MSCEARYWAGSRRAALRLEFRPAEDYLENFWGQGNRSVDAVQNRIDDKNEAFSLGRQKGAFLLVNIKR